MYYAIFGKRLPNIYAIFEFQSIEQNNQKTVPKNSTNKRVVVLLQKWRTTLAVTGKTGTNSYSPVLDVLLD
jgi:hypothetical protein